MLNVWYMRLSKRSGKLEQPLYSIVFVIALDFNVLPNLNNSRHIKLEEKSNQYSPLRKQTALRSDT